MARAGTRSRRSGTVAESRRLPVRPRGLSAREGRQLTTPSSIHHINFVVRDLDEAYMRFEKSLGLAPFEVIDHAPRGAHVARIRLGESWLVLVAPYDCDSVAGRYLAGHGEGFFLLSLGVDTVENPRAGILDWLVEDFGEIHGALFQLTQMPDPDQ